MTTARPHFFKSSELEYFTESTLNKQIGYTKSQWGITLVKELIDNSLDATEKKGVAPDIKVVIGKDFISVQDNGCGIPEHVIKKSLNYTGTMSDKAGYVSPSRGQQGNALMCVYSVPYVAMEKQAYIEIHSLNTRYDIAVSVDKIAQKILIESTHSESDFIKTGTFIKIHDFDLASLEPYYWNRKEREFIKSDYVNLIISFASCNNHATFELLFDGDCHKFDATVSNVDGWTTNDPLVSHWYNEKVFRDLIASFYKSNNNISVNDFIKLFKDLKGSKKQKEVCQFASIDSRDGLRAAVHEKEIIKDWSARLLSAMKSLSKPVQPVRLGKMDKDHLKYILCGGEVEYFKHKYFNGFTSARLPYAFDIVFWVQEGISYDGPIICANRSVLIKGTIKSFSRYIQGCLVNAGNPVGIYIHMTTPDIKFLDKGKSQIELDSVVLFALIEKLELITKEWVKQKKRTRRDEQAVFNKEKVIEQSKKTKFMAQNAAIKLGAEAAYMAASDNNVLPADNRQVYYKGRDQVLKLTDKDSITQVYYSDMLREFQRENPELTQDWKILYNPRGNFVEPHDGETVPIGTAAVEDYLPSINETTKNFKFGAVLLIEKEGFDKLFKMFGLQEKWDIGIMSIKGMPTEAARVLVEAFFKNGIKTMVFHDFDLAGLNILKTCYTDTKNYQFTEDVVVHDIGLRLEDVQALKLENEPFCFKKMKDPKQAVLNAGGTEAESNYLVRKRRGKVWYGKRVELNAMDSRMMLNYLEQRFEEIGIKKAVPNNEHLIKEFKSQYKSNIIDNAVSEYREHMEYLIDKTIDKIKIPDAELPENIHKIIIDQITGTKKSWENGMESFVYKYSKDVSIKEEFENLIKLTH